MQAKKCGFGRLGLDEAVEQEDGEGAAEEGEDRDKCFGV